MDGWIIGDVTVLQGRYDKAIDKQTTTTITRGRGRVGSGRIESDSVTNREMGVRLVRQLLQGRITSQLG
jgi:hypothetical protein